MGASIRDLVVWQPAIELSLATYRSPLTFRKPGVSASPINYGELQSQLPAILQRATGAQPRGNTFSSLVTPEDRYTNSRRRSQLQMG